MKTRYKAASKLISALGAIAIFAAMQGNATADWDPNKVKAREAAVAETIAAFAGDDPSLERFFDSADGYAVFPKIGEAAFIVGGEHGKGEVFEKGESIGTAKITAVSVGLSLGGATFQEIIFFKSKEALDEFKKNKYTVGADASAVAVKKGAGAKAVWSDDIAVFVRGQKGAMVDASVNGQRFKFEAH